MPPTFTIHTRWVRPVYLLQIADGLLATAMLPIWVWWFGVSWGDHYSYLLGTIFPIAYLAFRFSRLYQPWRGKYFLHEVVILMRSWWMVAGVVIFFLFATKTGSFFSRRVLFGWMMTTPVVIMGAHAILRCLLKWLRNKGLNTKTAIVAGNEEAAQAVRDHLQSVPWTGIDVLQVFNLMPADDQHSRLDAVSSLTDCLKSQPVDYLFLSLPFREERMIQAVLSRTRTLGSEVFLVPDFCAFNANNIELTTFEDLPVISFNPSQYGKRFFDILFSSAALLLLSPLMLVIALAVKLQDGGPVLFAHERVTAAGRSFRCLKFRTMQTNADEELLRLMEENSAIRKEWVSTYKLKDDPRVTWLGRFLRRMSLDELPQFYNVLKGEMSVVGARPVVKRELERFYQERAGLYCSAKPGITGPWQTGLRSDETSYTERVNYDVSYILKPTLLLDLKIITKTVVCIFTGRGSY